MNRKARNQFCLTGLFLFIAWVIWVALLCAFVSQVKAMPIRDALGQIESADRDNAKGRAGEVSRYQIMPAVWSRYSTNRNYSDPETAWSVASRILKDRTDRFEKRMGRPITSFEIYVLWNAPAQLTRNKVSRVVAERAQRFENLVNSDGR